MVESEARILVDELPRDVDVEAARVHDQPVCVEPVEDRDLAEAEKANDGEAAPIRVIRGRVGHVGGWGGNDVYRRVRADAVAGLEIGEDDRPLGNLREG